MRPLRTVQVFRGVQIASLVVILAAPIAARESMPPSLSQNARAPIVIGTYLGATYANLVEDWSDFYILFGVTLGYNSPLLQANFDVGMSNSGRYAATEEINGPLRFLLNEGRMNLDLEPLTITTGHYAQRDIIDSPYALFLNARNLPRTGVDMTYEDDVLFFATAGSWWAPGRCTGTQITGSACVHME